MPKELDINSWNRKEHFEFFSKFEEPFFGITTEVDCSKAYALCKKKGYSFFLYYLHKSLCAANDIASFKYRIADDRVIIHDQINASATINRPNATFGFSNITFHPEFSSFTEIANKEIERVRNTDQLLPAVLGENVIHFSSIPWINFTALSHARNYSINDSCPKISFGKMVEKEGKKMMAVSIHVHHALMDGYHVGQFVEAFQKYLNTNL